MFETRLLDRICAGAAEGRPTVDASALLAGIVLHLRELFNARQGSVPIRPDYGLPDINELTHVFPDAIEILREEIRRQVVAFEPRLRDVAVRHVPLPDRPVSLTFAVVATLAASGRRERVTVETEVGENGAVRLTA